MHNIDYLLKMIELQNIILKIPDDSLYYHLSLNHFSRFFYSRAMFPVAEMLRKIDVTEYTAKRRPMPEKKPE